MPTIIRRQVSSLMENRREVYVTTSWQVHSSIWTPPTDVYETETGLIVKVEVAGMREEDFEVVVEDQILMIRGVRPEQMSGAPTTRWRSAPANSRSPSACPPGSTWTRLPPNTTRAF